MSKLVAQMVARNEADRYLEEVLIHLKPLVDQIVFTDDCSDDNTVEIAKKYTDLVFQNEEPLFPIHEGKLRSQAWANLTTVAEPGDWILGIDADEKLWSTQQNLPMRRLLDQDDYDVLNIVFYHKWDENRYRVDKAWRPSGSFRLYRYFYGGQFKDKKLACGSEPVYVETLVRRGRYLRDTGLVMEHLGYQRDEDKQSKFDRYMKLDHGDFHSLDHIKSIMDPDPVLEVWNNR